MTRLGVNIDNIATLRQQRKEGHPNLANAAQWAINGGADNITMHLREDRRHIQDADIFELRPLVNELNFECATAPDIIDIAIDASPSGPALSQKNEPNSPLRGTSPGWKQPSFKRHH